MSMQTVSEEKQEIKGMDAEVIKRELDLAPVDVSTTEVDPEVEQKANTVTTELFNVNHKDVTSSNEVKSSIEGFGLKLQHKSTELSKILRAPISQLAKRSDDGGDIANGLVNLKVHVEELDPAEFDITNPGWLSRLFGHLPFVGTPVKRYFTKFEKTSTVLEAIAHSLEKGKDHLGNDNKTLIADQARMRILTQNLEKTIALAILIDQKLTAKIESELSIEDEKRKFIQEEILFPLRQRIMDLQQQLIVNQQGIIAIEIIIRNNKELIRGVNRTLGVTMSALNVGATLAIALADQKIVLDKVNSVNDVANKLIAGTAERLKTQGVEIHKQASTTQIDIEVLKKAFSDVKSALEDISNFRQQALPKMAGSIVELDKMSHEQEKVIVNLEKGNDVKHASPFEFSDEE